MQALWAIVRKKPRKRRPGSYTKVRRWWASLTRTFWLTSSASAGCNPHCWHQRVDQPPIPPRKLVPGPLVGAHAGGSAGCRACPHSSPIITTPPPRRTYKVDSILDGDVNVHGGGRGGSSSISPSYLQAWPFTVYLPGLRAIVVSC